MGQMYLTAIRSSPSPGDRSIPKVISLDGNSVVKTISVTEGGKERTIVKTSKGRYLKSIKAAEKLGEVLLQQDFNNAASSPYNTGSKTSIAAAGTAAAGAATTNAYHVSITAATGGSAIGVRLPAATDRELTVIFNKTAVPLSVFPAASHSLNGLTAGVDTIPAGAFKHYYSPAASSFVTCKGPMY